MRRTGRVLGGPCCEYIRNRPVSACPPSSSSARRGSPRPHQAPRCRRIRPDLPEPAAGAPLRGARQFRRAKICEAAGDELLADITPKVIRRSLDGRADTPESANGFLEAMRGLFEFAVEYGYVTRTDGAPGLYQTWRQKLNNIRGCGVSIRG